MPRSVSGRIAIWFVWFLLATPCSGLLAAGNASPVARLVDTVADNDVWPMATVLVEDRDWRLDAAEALARSDDFRIPDVPHANLGVQKQAVWMRVAVDVAADSDGKWLLDIDYPSLDEVAVAVTRGGEVESQQVLGRSVTFDRRPMATRSHMAALSLQPGGSYVILMRVETVSSMIVPVRLAKQESVNAREARIQLIQGIAVGIGLWLMLYALAHWVNLRDPSFLYYALSVGSITLFFFSFEGLAAQHLWGRSEWLTRNASPLLVQPSRTGGLLFLERALEVRRLLPWLDRAMLAMAALTVAVAVAFVLGWLDYRQTHLAGTILGLTPIILGLPAAWLRARSGDRIALFILAGWGVYAFGIIIMAALLRGYIEFNAWTQHAFQVGALSEMVVWVFVLGVRASEIRRRAERTERERQALHHLAHTDALTGLLNRRGLQSRLREEIDRVTPDGVVAVYLIDLDGFKAVNDRFGHDAGDELLCAVGKRLRATLRDSDVIARLGGDEFVMIAPAMAGDDGARQLGQKLLDAFREPFEIHGSPCTIGLTIGYALAPADGDDVTGLLRAADAAMYAGKQDGESCVRRAGSNTGPGPT